jgi:hypothetical protein
MISTAETLIADIQQGVALPAYQARYTDEDLLLMADKIIAGVVVPMILAANPALLLFRRSIPVVSGQREYRVPDRAIGRVIRTVFYVDASGNSAKDSMRLVDPSDEQKYSSLSGDATALFFEGGCFVPCPQPTSGSFMVTFPLQPSALVKTTSCARIQSIDRMTGDITLVTALTGVSTGTPIDLIAGSQGYQLLNYDISPTNVSGVTVTVATTAIPTSLVAGDYVAFAGQTPVIPIPRELCTLISLAVQKTVLGGLGDVEMLQAAQAEFKDARNGAMTVLQPQLIGQRQKIGTSPILSTGRLGSRCRIKW